MPVRILIADDNPSVRTALQQLLRGFDWEILEAECGEQAISKSLELLPAVAVIDLAMPGMDGLTAARRIHEQRPEIPILMFTMHRSPQIEQEAYKYGVQKVISKANSDALISAIQDLVSPQPQATTTTSPEATLLPVPADPVPILAAIDPPVSKSAERIVATPGAVGPNGGPQSE